jgi:hypothetical protein
MKLSQIKGERAYDVLTEVIEPIGNIMTNEKSKELLVSMKDKNPLKILPKIMKSHKEDLIKVLAALDGISVTEYKEKLTLAKLTNDFVDLLTDEESQKLFINAEPEEEEK